MYHLVKMITKMLMHNCGIKKYCSKKIKDENNKLSRMFYVITCIERYIDAEIRWESLCLWHFRCFPIDVQISDLPIDTKTEKCRARK